jgi:cell division protein FtsQ
VSRYDEPGIRNASGLASGMLTLLVLFLASAAGIVWVGLGIVAPDRWPIRWLEVNGEFQRVSAEQLRASLAPEMDSSFFTVDIHGLEKAAKRISWVSAVNVQKVWPDTVAVTVEEFVPVAHWNRGRLVSPQGDTFGVPEADELQGLPWLSGPEARLDDVLSTWVGIDESIAKLGLEVARLSLDSRGSWSLELNNGTQVYLGRNSMEERLERLLSSWDALMEEQEVPPRDIDLRYTNGFAVAWPADTEETTRSGS